MPAAIDLLTAAFRKGRILGADQVPTDSESADALAALNRMLDAWRIDKQLVYQVVQENFALVAGQASRTIGAGGNFDTSWPVKIVEGCFVRRNGEDTPIKVLEERVQYDAIPIKTTQGLPRWLFYDRAYPLGTIYFYFVPDAADQVYLNSWKQLQAIADLAAVVTLPPGYEDLIVDGLAIRLCPEYGLEVPQSVKTNFATTKRNLGNVNAASLVMEVDSALLPRGAGFDIRTG